MSEEIVDALQDVESAVSRVETAVGRVETAVGKQSSSAAWVLWAAFGVFLWSLPGEIWHSKWRYALAYNVDFSKVLIDNAPHDCAFLAAPLGEKYCHYERIVSTIRWGTSTSNGQSLVSYDDGKTWSVFTPKPTDSVPQSSTVEQLIVGWKKTDD
jgi:hypothetical protein